MPDGIGAIFGAAGVTLIAEKSIGFGAGAGATLIAEKSIGLFGVVVLGGITALDNNPVFFVGLRSPI